MRAGALERWRDAGSKEGEVARDRLAVQVQIALKVLGSGFLEANPDLRDKLKSGEVNLTEWFNELLRLVYRLIFLMVAEDRNLLHPEKAKPDAPQALCRRLQPRCPARPMLPRRLVGQASRPL